MISSAGSFAQPQFDLEELNQRFEVAHPNDILDWCAAYIPVGLVQVSAFNVDDMVITDILYRRPDPLNLVPVLFLDTLHHFPQTLELVQKAQRIYNLDLHVYKTLHANTREEFAARYGATLWEKDVAQFHELTKIEPLQRGLTELNAIAWITGRRRDQATTRTKLPIFEHDKHGCSAVPQRGNRLKINPLANWTRKETWTYIMDREVIYNPLHDRGYPSIGDEPLTTPIAEGEDERAGRWRGTSKTECGIHL